MAIFSQDTILKRRNRVAAAMAPVLKNGECLLVFCGEPLQKPGGLDQTYDFLPHPTYFWLTGHRDPHGVVFYSQEHGWVDFVKQASKEELVWESAGESFVGEDLASLEGFLRSRQFSQVFKMGQAPFDASSARYIEVSEVMDSVRRVKDAAEVELIESIALIANKGYEKIKAILRPGVSERQVQIEFEAEIQRHGALGMPYGTIVGTGKNAAILHATPTAKIIGANDMVLVDAGAEVHDYCVDITRMFAASGKLNGQQQAIYDLVLRAHGRAIESARIGVEWHAVHRISAEVIAEGLKDLQIMRGDTQAILDSGAIAMFYPHGVGHLVGLRVRDVGKYNPQPKSYCGARLRVDLKLQENYLITVEPGCYFIESLLNDPERKYRHHEFINWQELEKWKDIGGVRIEDNILITQGLPKNLTDVVAKY